MINFHKQYPLYLTPTTATAAPRNDDPAFLSEDVNKLKTIENLDSDQQMQLIYESWLHGLSKSPFTQLANLSGEPAISLPTYVSSDGLPLGIQFQAAQNNDRLLLKIGDLFEKNGLFKILTHTTKNPPANKDTPITSSSNAVPTTTTPSSKPEKKRGNYQKIRQYSR
ncbi:amidase family protein [Secundilactobacillus oryzae]|uniref:amidase family protein n=1 Tax=Secundilactobacillus oryzae TaxID=1202668 RepID=UPI0006CF319E|nr:amidase family protein [Secundilactobacillus oryzae]